MNRFRLNQRQPRSISTVPRQGLSIIEVLTSIVVAMIGVFGIMVLIPFSVKQSKSGLDKDAGTVLARNALSEMEIRGYRTPDNWRIAAGTAPPVAPAVYMVDPIFVTENGFGQSFPYNLIPPNTFPYSFQGISLAGGDGTDAVPTDITAADARRIFVSENELVFGEAPDDLTGPSQIFDAVSGVDLARRQYQGSLSMSLMMVPFGDFGTVSAYQSYVFIYKNRVVIPGIEESQMFSAPVVAPTGIAAPVGSVTLAPSVLPDDYNIAKDDWVMLVNQDNTQLPGFEHQISFYRVVNYDIDETPGARQLRSITLDGPDFDFGDGSANWEPTFMLHLKDVISVYERNIVPEGSSTWNTF